MRIDKGLVRQLIKDLDMKNTIILGLAASVAFGSFSAFAASDAQYPAADFQPKVIFIDKDAAGIGAATTAEPKCKESKAQTVASADKVEFDPKYPAANFQPKVIYP